MPVEHTRRSGQKSLEQFKDRQSARWRRDLARQEHSIEIVGEWTTGWEFAEDILWMDLLEKGLLLFPPAAEAYDMIGLRRILLEKNTSLFLVDVEQ